MKLFVYDFIILHRSDKLNSIDASFRRLDYKRKNEFINRLLLTLQKKLALVKRLCNFIFQVICNVYEEKIHLSKYDFETTKIHSINALKFNNLIIHVKQNLQIIMTVAIQKTYLNIIYTSKRKNS